MLKYLKPNWDVRVVSKYDREVSGEVINLLVIALSPPSCLLELWVPCKEKFFL